ncbi:IS3 family transposase (plasmid) [Iamia sp. SCSIO 61187]|uniref:IS3 family transposase n=1 Tax=Iamia sp. SCSIO 61187 TaxID=2722752 RepID=UPI001C63A24E|nr:IS3 family transposase [Iamia sp. SCSIO 61187]QYG95851.1 IS3 family transposase [Iamia sp. SCSIO 61187]
MTGFRFVDEHQAEYRISDLCRVAGASRSGFYAWRSRGPSERHLADAELLGEIRAIHEASRGTYGAPRVRGQLRRRGRRVSRKRVARLMATNGLVGAHSRRRWRRGRHPAMVPAPDLLNRDFTAPHSDLRWVADITEFACCDGKLYLAGIRDLHDRGLAGWSMGERQTTDLVVAALVMALGRRRPAGELVHHADHGPQYTSVEFTNRLADWDLAGSYGSVGDAFDNAAMETFWATLKREIRHIWGPWETLTRSELRTILFDYIEVFYNRRRHQTGLDHRTPAEAYHPAPAA